jgi:5-methylcytosine-specific restriction endonuclease McrA
MSRSLPEWIGKTPDQRVPPRVRARIFLRHHGICHRSGRKIGPGDKWDLDHIIALINGGEHKESNLAPILRDKAHKEKTAEDMRIKSKTARMRAKHLGIRKPRKITRWRKMDGTPVYAGSERSAMITTTPERT